MLKKNGDGERKEIRVSAEFGRAFALVMEAFQVPADDVALVKATARENLVAAEDAIYADAAMIRAGWQPLKEHASAFIKRTGFVVPSRWQPEQAQHVDVQWPSLDLRRAA